jgi:hypothetical protein
MERLSESNMIYTERNPLSDLIMDRFDWESLSVVKMSATDVCMAMGYDKPTNKQIKDAGAILRKATGKEPSRSNGKVLFAVPPLKRNSYKQEQNFEDDNSRPF